MHEILMDFDTKEKWFYNHFFIASYCTNYM
jgi:hypothetical protein